MEKGGLIFEDLQLPVDDAGARARLIKYWKAGAPPPAAPEILLPFEEPESHRMAKEILGKDFLGVEAAQRRFGAYTQEQLTARREIPFSEQALRECAGEFALLATHQLDLPGVHGAHPERFKDDPDSPWFSQADQQEKWSSQKIADPWLLVRKNVLPQSSGKNIDAQKKHIEKFPRERHLIPAEFGYAGILLFLETGQKLCKEYVVRFLIQTPGGDWVHAEWFGDQLGFNDWDGRAHGRVASGSARTS
jgi:hypothetical protein